MTAKIEAIGAKVFSLKAWNLLLNACIFPFKVRPYKLAKSEPIGVRIFSLKIWSLLIKALIFPFEVRECRREKEKAGGI